MKKIEKKLIIAGFQMAINALKKDRRKKITPGEIYEIMIGAMLKKNV